MEIVISITYVLFSIAVTLTIYELYEFFFQKKNKLPSFIMNAVYFIYFVFSATASLMRINTNMIIIINISILLVLSLLYKATWRNRIYITLGIAVSFMIIEMIVPIVVLIIIGGNIKEISENLYYMVIIGAGMKVVPYIGIKIYVLKKSYSKKLINGVFKMPINIWSMMLILPIGSVVLIYYLFQLLDSVPQRDVLMIMFFLFFINIVYVQLYTKLLYLLERQYEAEALTRQLEVYESQYKLIQDKLTDYSRLRHDLKHEMLTIITKVKTGEVTDSVSVDSWINDIVGIQNVRYTECNTLNVILNYYFDKGKKQNVAFDIIVDVLEKLQVDDRTLCIVIGNILDNALEACENIEDKFISIKIIQQYDNIYIRVCNKYKGNLIWENNLPKTNKKEVNNHGYGLQSVKKLVEIKGGNLTITENKNEFVVEIIL